MTATAPKSRQRVRTHPPGNGGSSVNDQLTSKREIEATEYTRIVNAFVRALTRRGLAGDIQALIALAEVHKAVAQAMHDTAVSLRTDHGYSWAEVGLAFGVSKQAAQQRWGRP